MKRNRRNSSILGLLLAFCLVGGGISFALNQQSNDPSDVLFNGNTLMGNTVIDKAGKELGTVKDLLINQAAGRIEYIIMSYGGTLGIGEDDYSLPWKDVTLTTSDSEMVIQVNEAPIRDTQTSLGNRSSRN